MWQTRLLMPTLPTCRQLLLCLALKQHTPEVIRQLLDQLKQAGLLGTEAS
jgi:hypothetical protein